MRKVTKTEVIFDRDLLKAGEVVKITQKKPKQSSYYAIVKKCNDIKLEVVYVDKETGKDYCNYVFISEIREDKAEVKLVL